MGISDLEFDILAQLEEEVKHLPPKERRAEFMKLAKKFAADFIWTASRFTLCDDRESEGEPEPKTRKVDK